MHALFKLEKDLLIDLPSYRTRFQCQWMSREVIGIINLSKNCIPRWKKCQSPFTCILREIRGNDTRRFSREMLKEGAAIAQWIHLCLPSCCPRFEFQAHHLCFQLYSYLCYICHVKRTKISKKTPGRAHFLIKRVDPRVYRNFCWPH